MTTMVCARIPLSLKREADATLARMGASQTELIRAAYEYVIEQGRLPTTTHGTRDERPKRLLLAGDVLRKCLARDDDAYARRLVTMASFGDMELWASVRDVCDAFHDAASDQHVFAVLHTCELTPEQVEEAAAVDKDFDVALTEVIARSIEADAIVASDPAQYEGVAAVVLTPADVVARMRDERGLEFEELSLGCVQHLRSSRSEAGRHCVTRPGTRKSPSSGSAESPTKWGGLAPADVPQLV